MLVYSYYSKPWKVLNELFIFGFKCRDSFHKCLCIMTLSVYIFIYKVVMFVSNTLMYLISIFISLNLAPMIKSNLI